MDIKVSLINEVGTIMTGPITSGVAILKECFTGIDMLDVDGSGPVEAVSSKIDSTVETWSNIAGDVQSCAEAAKAINDVSVS